MTHHRLCATLIDHALRCNCERHRAEDRATAATRRAEARATVAHIVCPSCYHTLTPIRTLDVNGVTGRSGSDVYCLSADCLWDGDPYDCPPRPFAGWPATLGAGDTLQDGRVVASVSTVGALTHVSFEDSTSASMGVVAVWRQPAWCEPSLA